MIPGPRVTRLLACTALLVLSVVAAVSAAAWQEGTGWLQTVYMWCAIALLTWGIMDNDKRPPGGLPLWTTSAGTWAACCTA